MTCEIKDINFDTQTKFEKYIFQDSTEKKYSINFNSANKEIIFIKCEFRDDIEFRDIADSEISISFCECIFKGEVKFFVESCKFLYFEDNLYLNKLFITETGTGIDAEIQTILFKSKDEDKHLSFDVKKCSIDVFHCEDIKIMNSVFRQSFIDKFFLTNSHVFSLEFKDIIIKEFESYRNKHIGHLNFSTVKFDSHFSFTNNSSIFNSLSIDRCTFNSTSNFDGSIFLRLKINDSTFDKPVSFQNVEVESIEIEKTNFNGKSFFDEFKVKSAEKCNRKTLRTIKNQLLLQGNQIDYNRFKVLELDRYSSELNFKDNPIDKSILKLYSFSSDYGTNWIKAILITIFGGFIFYLLFFIIYNFNNSFDVKYTNEFFSGYFRFLLITDYYNPLISERIFLSKWYLWIPFILGKIFIAFGIYETVQSFRKYRN